MPVNTKAIKTRIKSVKNTKKITKAMQMIAAVKMRKAVESAIQMRSYANLAYELLDNLAKQKISHPLMLDQTVSKTLIIMVTSNRGLCGSYNANVAKTANQILQAESNQPDILALGKKSAAFAKRNKLNLLGVYERFSENVSFEDVIPIAVDIMNRFKAGEYGKVEIVYTNYVSGLLQIVEHKQVLPLKPNVIKEMVDDITTTSINSGKEFNDNPDRFTADEYAFEPNRTVLIEYLIPLLVEVQIYHSILESAASEHSSRMMAMKNATESAGEMIDNLTLIFNKGRQAAITQEIAEITSGANALEQD